MTFRSLSIESHECRQAAHAKFGAGAQINSSNIFSLNACTFLAPTVILANEHDLAIDCVDSASRCVAIDGRLLKYFLQYGAETEPDKEVCLSKIHDDDWLFVSEEEF